MASRANANETTSTAQSRRHRYSRSTTSSVTQLLSESCSSLLHRITTRVRGTSTTADNITASTPSSTSSAVLGLGITRSRLEDKYSSVLDKYGRRRGDAGTRRGGTESRRVEKESEREVSKSPPPLTKSATTANMILAEKSYPYVSKSTAAPVREKTPYRHGEHRLLQQQQQAYSSSRHRHKSGQGDHSRRVPVRPVRVGKSEQGERKLLLSGLRLCPVEIEPSSTDEPPKQEHPIEDAVNEREARRKEIQSLIMKYTALDEVYNKSAGEGKCTVEESSGRVVAPEGKYYLLDDAYNRAYEATSNKQKSMKSSNVFASKYQHKYTSAGVPTVSSGLA